MNCKEFFLNDIVALALYNPDKTTISPPFNVDNITKLDTLTLPFPFKQIKTNASEDGFIEALGDTLTCKATYAKSGVRYLYTYNIEITLSPNNPTSNFLHLSDYADDFLMVATTAEGKRYLIYTAPFTFDMNLVFETASTALKISAMSMSNFIPLPDK